MPLRYSGGRTALTAAYFQLFARQDTGQADVTNGLTKYVSSE